MKKLIFLLFFSFLAIKGQDKTQKKEKEIIEAQFGKTTYLVFPNKIEDYDVGDPEGFQFFSKENILKIKPLNAQNVETNMLVKTTEGDYFVFSLLNLVKASNTDYFLKKSQAAFSEKENIIKKSSHIILDKEKIREKKIEVDIKNVACPESLEANNYLMEGEGFFQEYVEVKKQKIKIILSGIFINESNMYFKMKLVNKSPINFKVADSQFIAIDKEKKAKTSTYQPRKIPIIARCNKLKEIKNKQENFEVFVTKNITLLEGEDLYFELFEEQPANRHLSLKIPFKLILDGRSLF